MRSGPVTEESAGDDDAGGGDRTGTTPVIYRPWNS